MIYSIIKYRFFIKDFYFCFVSKNGFFFFFWKGETGQLYVLGGHFNF